MIYYYKRYNFLLKLKIEKFFVFWLSGTVRGKIGIDGVWVEITLIENNCVADCNNDPEKSCTIVKHRFRRREPLKCMQIYYLF